MVGSSSPPAAPPQFSLGMIFVVTLAASIAVAPAYYLVRGAQGQPGMQLVGMLLVLAGPLLLMVLVSVMISLLWWLRQR